MLHDHVSPSSLYFASERMKVKFQSPSVCNKLVLVACNTEDEIFSTPPKVQRQTYNLATFTLFDEDKKDRTIQNKAYKPVNFIELNKILRGNPRTREQSHPCCGVRVMRYQLGGEQGHYNSETTLTLSNSWISVEPHVYRLDNGTVDKMRNNR